MSYSPKELRVFVEKIAKQVLKDESNKTVVDGIITESCAGYYKVHLSKGSEASEVTATSLYTGRAFNKDDHVYLVEATISTGDDKNATYFVVGLVDAVDTQFFNLTEAERFQGDNNEKTVANEQDGVKDIFVMPSDWHGDTDPSEEEIKEREKDNLFIDALRLNGVVKFSAIVSSKVNTRKDFGFKMTTILDNGISEERFFTYESFSGQFWLMNHVVQTKVFTFDKKNKISYIGIEPYQKGFEEGEFFNVHSISLECGTLLDVAQDFSVSISNVTGKTYFKDSTDNGIVQLKAIVNYGNQKLDTNYLKYYWFVEDDRVKKPFGGETNKLENTLGAEGDSTKDLIPFNPILGSGWHCLNKGEFAYVLDAAGNKVENTNISIYENTSDTIELTKDLLIKYENKIKCVATYQLAQAESEPYSVYNFNHEDYEVELTSSKSFLKDSLDELTISAAVKSTLSGAKAPENVKYTWFWNGGEISGQTGATLVVKGEGWADKKLTEKNIFYCSATITMTTEGTTEEIVIDDKSTEVAITYLEGSAIKTEYNYQYLISETSNVRFTKRKKEEGLSYYVTQNGTQLNDADSEKIKSLEDFKTDASDFLFADCEDGKDYYLFASSQAKYINQKNEVEFIEDFTYPIVLRYIFKDLEGSVVNKATDQELDRINEFNKLTNGGQSQGIYYTNSVYEITKDESPDENKLATGRGYYKKEEYIKAAISEFKDGIDYYTKVGETNKYLKISSTAEFEEGAVYYIKLSDPTFTLRPKDDGNYEIKDGKIVDFKKSEEYYEQLGDDLYINAEFIRSGHLEVSNGENAIFSADLDKKAVSIGGFHVTEDHFADGEVSDSTDYSTGHTVMLSPGLNTSGKEFCFWAGDRKQGGNDVSRPFWVTTDGEVQVSTGGMTTLEEISSENGILLSNLGLGTKGNVEQGQINYYADDGTITYPGNISIMKGYLSLSAKIDDQTRSMKITPSSVVVKTEGPNEQGVEGGYGMVLSPRLLWLRDTTNYLSTSLKTNRTMLLKPGKGMSQKVDGSLSANDTNELWADGTFLIHCNKDQPLVDEFSSYIKFNSLTETDSLKLNSLQGTLSGTWKSSSAITVDSDQNKKHDILPLGVEYEQVFDALKPVKYKYNDGRSNRFHTGFIAQDLKEAVESAGLSSQDMAAYVEFKETDPESQEEKTSCGIRYEELIALCVKEIQQLKKRVSELETELKNKN